MSARKGATAHCRTPEHTRGHLKISPELTPRSLWRLVCAVPTESLGSLTENSATDPTLFRHPQSHTGLSSGPSLVPHLSAMVKGRPTSHPRTTARGRVWARHGGAPWSFRRHGRLLARTNPPNAHITRGCNQLKVGNCRHVHEALCWGHRTQERSYFRIPVQIDVPRRPALPI